MLKRFPFLWLILSLPVGLTLVHRPSSLSDSPINKNTAESYRRVNAISCLPFAYVPEDYLREPIEEKTGIGTVAFRISTRSGKAQLYFNQGMAFLYSFEYVQAARSLYTAASFDSTAPMIYWALSQAYDNLNDSTESRNMAAKAFSLSAGGSSREQHFTAIQHALSRPPYDSAAVQQQRINVSSLMDKANLSLPTDPELWLYTGVLRAYTDVKGPAGETYAGKCRQAIDNYLRRTLELSPNHFGAFHYLIHFNEGTSEFSKALNYGKLYTKSAPAIPHAWHMYAHDLMKTGRVSEAIDKFNYAFQLEEKKYVSEKMAPHYDWHHQHNMELLAYCYQYKGQFKKAEEIFSKLDTLKAFLPRMEGRIRKGHPYFFLQNNQPDLALKLAQPLISSPEATNQFMGNFIAGLALVFQKDLPGARKSYNRIIHIVDSMKNSDIQKGMRPADAAEAYNYMYARAGIVNMGAGLLEDAYDTTMLKKMKSIQETLLKQTGPDPWIDALYFLQMLTQLSINTGNLELAETSAKNMLLHDPEYAGGYLMLARIKKQQGDMPAAITSFEKAKFRFKDADPEFYATLQL
jgi:tetratricopeptide (TPR) repeat protein